MKKKWLAAPYIVWMLLFTVVPLILIGYYAFTDTVDGRIVFSLDNIAQAFSENNVDLILKSLKMAAISTVICLIIAYPVAMILVSKDFKEKTILIFLFVIPMWMNFLLRTYAWRYILSDVTWLNNILAVFGIGPVKILFTDFAVILGMVYNFLPFMILPIHTVLGKINPRVIEAAQDLGANKVNVFRKIIFPLSLPGVMSGIVMVFMPAVSTFIVSKLLGGGKYYLIGNIIENYFIESLNGWHKGAAVSLVLLAIILISMFILNRYDKDHEGGTLM